MAKQEKINKSGFVIKLSTETVQKLSEKVESEEKDVTSTAANEIPTKDDEKIIQVTESNEQSTNSNEIKKLLDSSNKDKKKSCSKSISEKLKDSKTDTASWGEYAPYVSYEGDVAIYTDPTNQQKYTWDASANSWKPISSEVQVPGRVYSYENDTHIYTEADGSKSFWDDEKKAWIPKVDDEFLAFYQMSYGFVDNTATSKEEVQVKKEEKEKQTNQSGITQKRKAEPQWFEASDDNNTKVYVSNLPLDTTEEEFVDLMQKCGLVERDPHSHKMKVKLYLDKEQNCFKGDALCSYIKIESVELALNLLDGSDYKGNTIKVERAHFQLKGEYNPALKPKKKKKKELEKLKKMQQKLFDWRPEKFIGERSKHERIVIVKNLFQPSDFDQEVQLILDYQQDLREECSKCGEVRKVVIYDRHPEGVAQITMKAPEEADAVIQLINGRWFGKRQISAEIWDGRTKYRIAETDADISQRIDKWGRFLEEKDDEDKSKQPADSVTVVTTTNTDDNETDSICHTVEKAE